MSKTFFKEIFKMDQQKLELWLMTNQKYFPAEKIVYLKEKLKDIDESKFNLLSTIELKDTTTMLLLSLFVGAWGVDRFMLGETGMGVLKLLTGGLCGILTIIDWFSITKKTKELNLKNVMMLL